VQLSGAKPTVRNTAPERGENTREILAELGYDATTIDDLQKRGVV
jgi:crotonobetainyl-CoA:carnitine CoA-transferase CaiB-like acyl-CoA transferase